MTFQGNAYQPSIIHLNLELSFATSALLTSVIAPSVIALWYDHFFRSFIKDWCKRTELTTTTFKIIVPEINCFVSSYIFLKKTSFSNCSLGKLLFLNCFKYFTIYNRSHDEVDSLEHKFKIRNRRRFLYVNKPHTFNQYPSN